MNTILEQRTIFFCCAYFLSLMFLVTSSFAYEKEINALSAIMAEKIAGTDKTSVAVVDFTDLQGNVTQLGRFIAEEFSTALAGTGKGFKVVDRTHLNSIIKENKLSATGLIDPETARKLGKIIGIQALITGTLTPFGDNIRVSVKVLDAATAEIIDVTSGNIAKTQGIGDLLVRSLMTTLKNNSATAKKTVNDKVENGGLILELQGCSLAAKRIECSIQLTSKARDMELYLVGKGSRIFDQNGKKYAISEVQLADRIDDRYVKGLLVADIQTNAKVSLDGFPSSEKSISLLEIEIRVRRKSSSKEKLMFKFRDVDLLKEER